MSRVLVAGSTGFLGKRVLEHASAAGHEVIALARPASVAKLDDCRPWIAETRTADLDDPAALDAALTDVAAVVTTVGMTKPEHGLDPDQVDHQGNLALLRAAERAGVGHFTYVSLDGIDLPGADDVAIVRAKKAFEDDLRASSIGWAISRPNGLSGTTGSS